MRPDAPGCIWAQREATRGVEKRVTDDGFLHTLFVSLDASRAASKAMKSPPCDGSIGVPDERRQIHRHVAATPAPTNLDAVLARRRQPQDVDAPAPRSRHRIDVGDDEPPHRRRPETPSSLRTGTDHHGIRLDRRHVRRPVTPPIDVHVGLPRRGDTRGPVSMDVDALHVRMLCVSSESRSRTALGRPAPTPARTMARNSHVGVQLRATCELRAILRVRRPSTPFA